MKDIENKIGKYCHTEVSLIENQPSDNSNKSLFEESDLSIECEPLVDTTFNGHQPSVCKL